jgi:Transposase
MMGAVAGIDWASQTHVCCVIDDTDGRVLERFDVTHEAASLRTMTKRLARTQVSGVAIERGDGPVVEVLLDAGIAVFVVPSRQVKGCAAVTGRRATRTTASTPTCWRTRCAPTAPLDTTAGGSWRHKGAAGTVPGPA